ncbi:C-C chemokine receptor type 9a [Synchiropus picturatus]
MEDLDLVTLPPSEEQTHGDLLTSTVYYDYPEMWCNMESMRDFRRISEPPLFWTIAVVGGVGNLTVLWIYLILRRRLKTMTDVYLLNLAVADLLFLVTLPLWAAEAAGSWTFGSTVCKVNSALYKVNLFSGMLLLTCISVDRYIVIVQTTVAHNSRAERRRGSRLVCGAVWLVSLLLATPELIFAASHTPDDGSPEVCRMVFPAELGTQTKMLVLLLQVTMGFCLPFAVMTVCYSKVVTTLLKTRNFQKHKAMRVILAVVAAFLLTQLPYNGALIYEAAQAGGAAVADCEQLKLWSKAQQILKGLAYTHACLNPILYTFIGVRFRSDFLQLLRCCRATKVPGSTKSKSSKSSRTLALSDSDTSQALSL